MFTCHKLIMQMCFTLMKRQVHFMPKYFKLFLQVLTVLAYNIQTKYAVGITCVALLAEVNGIFLHARTLMQIFQFSFGHKIYTVNKYINLITFVIFRSGLLGRICYAYLYECPVFTPTLRIVFVCISVAMTIINIVLFWRLCKSDMLKHKRKWENKKKKREVYAC